MEASRRLRLNRSKPPTGNYLKEIIAMLPELNMLYQSLENRKAEVLAALDALSDAQRSQNPTPTDWSPLQILEHLVIVEEWMATPLPPGNDKILLKGRLFMTFGVGAMRKGLRMPTLPVATPRDTPDFAATRQCWDKARTLLRRKLEAVTRQIQSAPIALHPIAGPLNAEQVLALLDAHLAYHCQHWPRVKS